MSGENRITLSVIRRSVTDSSVFYFSNYFCFRILIIKTIQEIRIHTNRIFRIISFFLNIHIRFYNFNDFQIEFLRKSMVALIVRRNSHYSASPITHQHIIRNINRNILPSKRIDGITSRESTTHVFHVSHSITFRLFGSFFYIIINFSFLFPSCQILNQRIFRRQNHKSCTENCIRSCGENFNRYSIFSSKSNLRTLRFPNPIFLRIFQRLWPIQSFQALQQSFGISRDSHTPLHHFLLENRETTSFGFSVFYFVIR